MKTPSTVSETARLQALHRYQILDTEAEACFDDLVQLATHICATPIALLNFIACDRQWFKAKVGTTLSEIPRKMGICPVCMANQQPLVIPDMRADPQWNQHPIVTGEPYVRFYAGVPLITPDGYGLGTLCVLDQVPRTLTAAQIAALEILARQVIAQLELRRHLSTLASSIAERQQAEAKIQQQAALLDIASDAILVHDLNHQITFWNKGAERLFGWSATEAIAQNVCELLQVEPVPTVRVAYNAVLNQGEWFGELHKTTKSGQLVIVESRWVLVRDTAGQSTSILTVDRDMTEKKQLEAQFFHAQRLESIGTLASGLAHDLNNILTPILAIAQLLPLKLAPMESQTEELLKMLETNARRGADLVKQVLSFGRGMEGKPMVLQPRHLILEIDNILKETLPKSISIQIEMEQSLWTVLGDGTQLHQVLMNLCVNARDAMPAGGTLKMTAYNQQIDENSARMQLEAQVGPYVVIGVKDSGTGIAPGIRDRIFEPFFTTKESGQGTGLGLSTVLRIVKSHGGFVNVKSDPDMGTEFTIFLPAVMSKEDAPIEATGLPNGEQH